MKKCICFILLLCTVTTLFTGCGKPQQEATDSIAALYDLYILGATTGGSYMGMSDKEVQNALIAYDDALRANIRANLATNNLIISEEALTQICDARKAALAKVSANYELVSSDNKTAVVKLTTTYFDEAAIDAAAVSSTQEAAGKEGITEYDEFQRFAEEYYAKKLAESYESATPSTEVKEITVNCMRYKNVWVPEDIEGFGAELGKAVIGQ